MPRIVVVYSPQLVQDRQEFETCNGNHNQCVYINASLNQHDDNLSRESCVLRARTDESEEDVE